MRKLISLSVSSMFLFSLLIPSVNASEQNAGNFSSNNFAQGNRVDLFTPSAVKVPWASIGFKILKYGTNEWLFQREATAEDSDYRTIISSGKIKFNSDGNGSSVKHDVDIEYKNNRIDTFAQTALINWLDKIAVNITDSSGNYVQNKTVTHNQHTYYEAKKTGRYTVEYTDTKKNSWDIWIQVDKFGEPQYPKFASVKDISADTLIFKSIDGKEGIFVKEIDGNVYRLPSSTHMFNGNTQQSTSLNMFNLHEQLFDKENNGYVSNFKDYQVGDSINFTDYIQDIEYSHEYGYTIFGFLGPEGTVTNWAFNGDLTNDYLVGEALSLEFSVVQSAGIFETLDYIKEATESELAPEIGKYLKK